MKALLLSAGIGSRLRPLTLKTPKCLVPINNKPLLQYWLEQLEKIGVKEFIINTHYLHDQVQDFIKKSKFSERITVIYEDELLGTGGTLKKNAEIFEDNTFLLVHADNLCITDFKSFVQSHNLRLPNQLISMMTFFSNKPEECGIVKADSEATIISFYEKKINPKSNLANGAVFIIEPKVLEFVKNYPYEKFDFSKDIIPHFIYKSRIWHNNFYHKDIGSNQSILEIENDKHLIKKLLKSFSKN